MAESRLSGASFESLIDRQVREAQERGAFDDLPGAGRPIEGLDAPHDPQWWIKDKLRREGVSITPPLLALRKEVETIDEQVADVRSESAVREIVAALDARVVEAIRRPTTGPVLPVRRVDVEAVVRRWRERRPS